MPRNRTEAELAAAGVASVKVRITPEAKRRLAELSKSTGYSMSDLVESWIDQEWEETEQLKAGTHEVQLAAKAKRG